MADIGPRTPHYLALTLDNEALLDIKKAEPPPTSDHRRHYITALPTGKHLPLSEIST